MPGSTAATAAPRDDGSGDTSGDGREPDSPTDLPRPSLLAVLRRVRTEFGRDNLLDLAAGLTYYAVLSVVPGLVVLVALLGLAGPDTTQQLISQVEAVAPGSASGVVRTLVEQAQSNQKGAGISAVIGLAVALWSASGYVSAFMRASNVVYGIREGRPMWKTIPVRLAVTLLAVVLLVAGTVIVVVSGPVAQQAGDLVGAGDLTVTLWGILKWPVLLVIITVLLAVLFWASPNAKQGGVRWVSPGGVVAVLVWLVVSGLFALYVATAASYDSTYGTLGGVVVFLVWLWLTNIAVLLGAEVNAELDHARAISEGLPEDVQPFAEPRDTRKLDDTDKAEVARAQAARDS